MAVADKKLVKTKSGLRMVWSNEAATSPFTLAEPPWIPDEECSYCMECQEKFGFTRRKHHCRRCGKCYCAKCCKHKVPLPRMCFVDPVILCSSCAQITKKENDFFDKSLKTLLTGSHFIVTQDDQEDVDTGPVFLCKLSSDNRYLLYEADNVEREAILMDKIQTVQILTSTIEAQVDDGNGNAVGTGIALKYKDELGDLQTVKMVVASGPGRKTGIAFVAAMQKGMRLLYDSRSMYED